MELLQFIGLDYCYPSYVEKKKIIVSYRLSQMLAEKKQCFAENCFKTQVIEAFCAIITVSYLWEEMFQVSTY